MEQLNNKLFKPLVSIITVVFNGEKTIKKTIQSVVNQTYNNIEYIIIDGKSTDNTLGVIDEFRNSEAISKIICEKDEGIYDAMNKGIKIASGDIIGIINSDDYYEENCVSKVVEAFANYPDIDIVHGILKYAKNDQILYLSAHAAVNLEKKMIEHPTCFVRASIYQRLNLFDITYSSASDYDFMIRARKLGVKFLMLQNVMATFCLGGKSESKKALYEMIKIRYIHKYISPGRYFLLRLYFWIFK